MKQNRLLLLTVASALLVTGCKEKIELDKVDSSMSVNTGIAAPIVTIKAPLNEILGISDKTGQSSQLEWIFAKVPGTPDYRDKQLQDIPDGTLFFRDTFDITRDFHPIDIGSFLLPIEEKLNIFEQAQSMGYTVSSGRISIPKASPLKFSFPLTVKLDSMNAPEFDNRVDLMRISTARFSSLISTNFGLKDADIQGVKLKLPKEFTSLKGKQLSDMRIPYHVEGDRTYIELKKFLINLQSEGATPSNRREHMINEVTFTIEFSMFTTHDITIDAASSINYTFDVELLTYDALYGYFDPSKWMEDKDTLVLAEEWAGWNDIKRLKMHFRYPSIRLIAEHQIGTEQGCPLNVNLKYIGVAQTDANGNITGDFVKAQFGEGETTDEKYIWELYDTEHPTTSRIDPIEDKLDKWAKNEYIVGYTGFVDEKTHTGDVDKLFDIRPDVIGYEYDITVGPKSRLSYGLGSQLRVVNNTKIDLHAITVVPFVLNEGSEIEYTDTVDVDFSGINFDSITNSVQWLDTINSGTIYVYLYAKNYIPFEISADYKFFDTFGREVDLPLVDGENGTKSYHLDIPAPVKYDSNGNVTETGNSTIVLRVTHEEFAKLQSIRKIAFTASVDNNPQRAIIHTKSGLDVTVGVAATVEAILKLF